jgi:hypothetical protein
MIARQTRVEHWPFGQVAALLSSGNCREASRAAVIAVIERDATGAVR